MTPPPKPAASFALHDRQARSLRLRAGSRQRLAIATQLLSRTLRAALLGLCARPGGEIRPRRWLGNLKENILREEIMRTQQVAKQDSLDAKQLLSALVALKRGNFSVRLPVEWEGLAGRIADTLNDVIELNEKTAKELERVSRNVGKEGKLIQRASLGNVGGSWATLIDSVNILIDDLVQPMSEMARVIGAVANGDLSQTTALEVDGRPLEGRFLSIAKTVNTMVNQLSSFASEVTRVAREVGTEGKLGGQAQVGGVAGTWKDLTDNVNMMAANLTSQVRNIAAVTTAVATGDLSRKITVDVEGEMLGLKNTINTMVDQLNSFASEVTRSAGRRGGEGRGAGQAQEQGMEGS